MACESKRISELPGVTRVYPNDLIPIVQDGTNKYITAKDLLGCHDHSGDDCCCSQALSKAITALDFSRTAMDLANKAYDKACLVGTKLAALEEKVAEHDTLICNIRSLITLIFNKFEELEGNLKVTIQLSIDDQNKKYKVLQGTREVETILVPRPTTDFENGDGRPADAAEVLRRLRSLKGEVSKNLNFVAGKFTLNGENYNGTVEKTVNIPTRTSHLINDGDPDGNPFLTGVKGYDGRTAPVTDGIADLSRIPIKLDDLNDVDAATPQAGDILYYDGTKWINTPLQNLIESIIDCDYIQNCVSNFKVTPKTHNKTAIETTAEYTVEATGAWTVAKESGDFITNFTPSGNGNGTITVTFVNNTTSSTRTAQFLVTETATGRLVRVTINQSGVTPTVNRTITYNVSGGLTNSIKVNNETITTTGTLTVPDGSNYSVPIVSNESGYIIKTVTPSAGTYNNGTLTINPITSDVTVLVVLISEDLPILTVTPTSLEVGPEGTTTPEKITVSTTCTTPGITTNTENLPTGITATLNSAQTLIDVEVDSSVAAGDYTFTVSDNCGNTETVTITKKDGEEINLFENVNFSNKKFNAFGVVEERFNNTLTIPLNAGVSDPYDFRTYANGSMYYQADLGSWRDISNNIDPKLPISLTDALGEQYSLVSGGQHDLTWLKNSALVQDRLAAIKNNTNLVYYTNFVILENMTPAYNGTIPAEYEQKSGASNEFPFYIVIAEDTDSITDLNNFWDAHVYVQLWCQPTNFLVSHPDNEVSEAHYIWEDSRTYNHLIIGLVWEYEDAEDPSNNYKMVTYNLNELEREGYELSPILLYKRDSICNTLYTENFFYLPITSDGYIYPTNSDISVSLNPTIAAFNKTTYNPLHIDFPDYTVAVYDNNDSPVNVNVALTSHDNTYGLYVDNFPSIEEQYKIEITAVSTNPLTHPSLTWSSNLYVSDTGSIVEPTINVTPIKQAYTRDGGYYGDSGTLIASRTPGIDGPAYSTSSSNLEKVGSGCAVRFNDTGNWTNIAISAGSNTINIPSTDFISWGTEENYDAVLNGAFTTSELTCPPPPLVFKGVKNETNVMELYIPYVSLNTQITVS